MNLMYWPKTNRLPDISPAKTDFFQDQHRITIQPWQATCKFPQGKGRRRFHRGEKEVGRARVNKESMAFHWLSPCPERSGVFLLPNELCSRCRVWKLPSLFNCSFCLLVLQMIPNTPSPSSLLLLVLSPSQDLLPIWPFIPISLAGFLFLLSFGSLQGSESTFTCPVASASLSQLVQPSYHYTLSILTLKYLSNLYFRPSPLSQSWSSSPSSFTFCITAS